MLSFQVVFPKQVLFTQTDLKERCHLILSLNLAPRGAAGCYSLGKDASWYFSGEFFRKRTALSLLPHSHLRPHYEGVQPTLNLKS